MKKVLIITVLALGLTLFAQEITHESLVINIEVPVRVFEGRKFVENLTMNDFEVFEDGVLQRLEAVYLIKGRTIERSEEMKKFVPQTSRNFYLFFEINDYTPRIGHAVDYFVENVMSPEDILTVITPTKTYRMNPEVFNILPREKIKSQMESQLKGILRRDALEGNSEYRNAIRDLADLAKSISSATYSSQVELGAAEYKHVDLETQLMMYGETLRKLEEMRRIDQKRLLDFSEYLKEKEGQKYVFLFYQREYIPQIEERALNEFISSRQDRQDILQSLQEFFTLYKREITFDVTKVKQAYANSSVSIHFLFFTDPQEHIPGIQIKEHSEDIFNAFMEIAKATGGVAESSANAVFLFQNALEASENYYLLYYSPINFKKDGQFKEIKVRLKDKDYKVLHRSGYFAD
jgi:VWFA-related protein